jgi:hypothetical protein
MKKSAIVLGSVIALMSSVQLAAAAPKHHQAGAGRTAVQQQRNADAFAYWPDARPYSYEPGPAYSGGYSAPAGR